MSRPIPTIMRVTKTNPLQQSPSSNPFMICSMDVFRGNVGDRKCIKTGLKFTTDKSIEFKPLSVHPHLFFYGSFVDEGGELTLLAEVVKNINEPISLCEQLAYIIVSKISVEDVRFVEYNATGQRMITGEAEEIHAKKTKD